MTKPNVTEVPRRLEPTSQDPFLGEEATVAPAVPVIRELDQRCNDGIDVRLLWNQTDNQVTVAVFDAKTGDAFEIEVDGREARDAFHHPYAHAAFSGID